MRHGWVPCERGPRTAHREDAGARAYEGGVIRVCAHYLEKRQPQPPQLPRARRVADDTKLLDSMGPPRAHEFSDGRGPGRGGGREHSGKARETCARWRARVLVSESIVEHSGCHDHGGCQKKSASAGESTPGGGGDTAISRRAPCARAGRWVIVQQDNGNNRSPECLRRKGARGNNRRRGRTTICECWGA